MLAALPAGAVLTPGSGFVQRLCQLNSRQHLDLLGLQLGGVKGDRLFHRGQCQQLHQVVLDHVACGADAVVVAAATTQTDVFGHGDLDVVDVVRVPDRVEQLIGEAQRQDILHRLLAQVVVDAKDRIFRKDAVDHFVEIAGTVQVVTERLLDDNPAPAVVLSSGQPGLVQLLADRRETLGRNGEVERVIAADAPVGVELVQDLGQPRERGVIVECAFHKMTSVGEPVPDRLPEWCAGMLLDDLKNFLCECCVVPVAPGESHQGEVGRQQTAVGQVVDGRNYLLAGQIAGHAESHHRARWGNSRQPLIALVPQWVLPLPGAIPGSGWTHLSAEWSCFSVSPSSSFHEASNFSTPSFSRTRNTSVKSMPMASSLSKTSWAAEAVPVTVSPVTTPWSATASMVGSGMVFTVFGATSSVT